MAAITSTAPSLCVDTSREGNTNILIMHDGGAVSSHGLLLDDTDELKRAAERSVGVGPFRALEMSHLQDVIILARTEDECQSTQKHTQSSGFITYGSMSRYFRSQQGGCVRFEVPVWPLG